MTNNVLDMTKKSTLPMNYTVEAQKAEKEFSKWEPKLTGETRFHSKIKEIAERAKRVSSLSSASTKKDKIRLRLTC